MKILDGPPFRSGNSLHFGHAAITCIKDSMNRYHGAEDRPGNDCHGLPIERIVENMGYCTSDTDTFIKKCIEVVNSYNDPWIKTFRLLGRNFDPDNQYYTMDKNYMESVWWVFGQLAEKGLIYHSYSVVPYSIDCKTAISNFEADNYKSVKCDSLYVKFEIEGEYDKPTYLVAWTTTPWTLPFNVALAVNPMTIYDLIKDEKEDCNYIVAKNSKHFMGKNFKILTSFYGSDLAGKNYKCLYPYFQDQGPKIYTVLTDQFVTGNESTTGVVHLAPGFGDIDMKTCLRHGVIAHENLGHFCAVDQDAKYLDIIEKYKGKFVFDCEKEIYMDLKTRGFIFKKESITHDYPHCPRTDKPLIYKLEKGVFMNVTKIKDMIIENNRKVNWFPKKSGNRFSSWLNGLCDWNLSRSRTFGTPIPIWTNGDETIYIQSIEELQQYTDKVITDIHMNEISDIEIPSLNGGPPLKIVPFVFDCWFDSGIAPIGQLHYPFENSNAFDNVEFLSDLVCEGMDQTRGWFYTTMVIATAIFNKPAFKNVICTGLIRASDGKKFSKRLGNCIPIENMIEKYSSDALRIYLVSSPVSNGEDLVFKESELAVIHRTIHQYLNCWNFYNEYKNKYLVDHVSVNHEVVSDNLSDKWILSRTETLKSSIGRIFETFTFNKVWDVIYEYVEDLTNWYIKTNRDRFKGLTNSDDCQNALVTLHKSIISSMNTLKSFMPFTTERFIGEIVKEEAKYPELEFMMKNFQSVVKCVRNLRNQSKDAQSSKKPINKVMILSNNPEVIESLRIVESYIHKETNCQSIIYPDFNDYVVAKVVANLKNIGIKFKKDSGRIRKIIETSNIAVFPEHNIGDDDYLLKYELKDEILPPLYYGVENDIRVIIDTTETDEIVRSYKTRLITSLLQKARKSAGLKSALHINLYTSIPAEWITSDVVVQVNCESHPYDDSINYDYSSTINVFSDTYDIGFIYKD